MTSVKVSPLSPLLQGLELLGSTTAGRDGTSYRAERKVDGAAFELRVFSGVESARSRRQLVQRLKRYQLLQHPNAVRLVALNDDAMPLAALFEWTERQPLQEFVHRSDVSASFPLKAGLAAASAVAAAHRIGLTHGNITPSTVMVSAQGDVLLDFSGVDTASRSTSDPRVIAHGPQPIPPPHLVGAAHEDEADDDPKDPAETMASDAARSGHDATAITSLLDWLVTHTSADQPTHPGTDGTTLARTPSAKGQTEFKEVRRLLDRWHAAEASSPPSAFEMEQALSAAMQRHESGAAELPADSLVPRDGMHPESSATADPGLAEDSLRASDSIEQMLRASLAEDVLSPDKMLGRFAIEKKLGEGGMGTVFEARDVTSGESVAIKVIRPSYLSDPQVLRRFHKEARLLAGVQHPNVVNLIDVNQDDDLNYLVMEYVPGNDLRQLLVAQGKLSESLALTITAGVLRGLDAAHQQQIVHRDIKPANILLGGDVIAPTTVDDRAAIDDDAIVVKLSDFGLARQIEQGASLELTHTGMMLGTPQYMAPEQCAGEKKITPMADIYALGATLFHMLAGRPPFVGEDMLELANQHRFEPPPSLSTLRPDVSEAMIRIIEKALAKDPTARYHDAGQMLADVQGLMRGEPSNIRVHPVLPAHDESHLFRADFQYDLNSPPEDIWPLASNTERINRAVGVPSVVYSSARDEQGMLHKFGDFRMAGLHIAWEELPFEWIEGRRLGVLREFSKGPFHWFLSIVEISPRAGGGTRLNHSVRIAPRGLMGWLVAQLEVNLKGRPKLKQVYHRIDDVVHGKLGHAEVTDPFEAPEALRNAVRQRLKQRLEQIEERSAAPSDVSPQSLVEWSETVQRLGAYLSDAAPQALARIRPFALARQWSRDRELVLDVCLHAAHVGLLELHWDLLCPTCRISSDVKDTLQEVERHSYCEVCDLDFELEFGSSIELFFRPSPEIRTVDLRTYCIGGPEHSPHVIAQVRLMPDECFELPLRLAPGTYLLRGPQLPYSLEVEVVGAQGVARADIKLGREAPSIPRLQTEGQLLLITNHFDRQMLIRLERTIPRKDVVTASHAATRPLFRKLFPHEALNPTQLLTISQLTWFVVEVENSQALLTKLGDAGAFTLVTRYREIIQEVVEKNRGVVVQAANWSTVHAVFDDAMDGLRAALALPRAVSQSITDSQFRLRAGMHRGPALVVTEGDRLAYFGQTVDHVSRLPQHAGADGMILSGELSSDPEVAAWLHERQVTCAASPFSDDPLAQMIRW